MRDVAAHGHFEPTPTSVARARRLVRKFLATLPDEVALCLELVVSELSTNAVQHARTAYEVTVGLSPVVRIEVADGSPTPPVRLRPDRTAPGGRGLMIVDQCAERWGTRVVDGGKIVWAELRSMSNGDGAS